VAGVTFDKQTMADMRRSLESLRLGAYVPRLAQLVAMGGVKLTMDTFRSQRDPYGHAWQPLARERSRDKRARLRAQSHGKKSRGQKILIDTSRMRNSATAIHQGRTGGVAIPTGYAAVHQHGAHIAPHSRLASYGNVTYRSGNRFVSARDAAKLHKSGRQIQANRFSRTYAEGIDIPQRMMLPDPALGLPPSWQAMTKRETVGLLTRWVKKGVRV
jgi:phage gpG-like protein